MATSSVNPLPVDPAKNAKYPVIISERLLNENQRSGWNLATVQGKSHYDMNNGSNLIRN